ncbi:MAG TPA: hypothetical protein VFC46_13865 [Humisphaera sp.]|nr:hypothetical protein [Humisphaera sp.]
MQAPTVADLLKELAVQQALEQAWLQSLPDDSLQRHEDFVHGHRPSDMGTMQWLYRTPECRFQLSSARWR